MNSNIVDEPMSFSEKIAVLKGADIHEYREKRDLRNRIYAESEKYLNSPVSEWPKISMNWDLSKESQCYSLDGTSKEEFDKRYPDGFALGYVAFAEFDKILCHYSRRDEGELWEVGFQTSLAYLIVYLSEGRKISPPLVKPLDNNELILNGGHHRYAIAKVIGVTELPIHVMPEYKQKIDTLLSVKWINV